MDGLYEWRQPCRAENPRYGMLNFFVAKPAKRLAKEVLRLILPVRLSPVSAEARERHCVY